ncbi:MAG TPA: hypothetical protein VIV40_11210 [Kofleriaceae bacterium]
MELAARLRRHFARRGEWWWVPVFYTLAVIWIYRDLWHQHGVATGLGWDTIDTHGPDLDFFARELREGRFSLWNPYDKGGYPVFCDPVFDRYYPLNWLFGGFGAAFGTSWWLVQIKVLAHHVLGGALVHLFLRSRGLSVRAALVGGLGLIASAPLLTHKASNILWPMVWVPLVWLAIDFALSRPSWRRGAAVAAALLPPITAGSPPGLFYAALMIAPYAIWRTVAVLRQPERRTKQALVQLAICAGVAAALALLVVAVTVVPTGELVALGSRDRFAPPGRAFALALSLPLPAAARGVFCRGAGLFELYMGVAVVVLAITALALRPRFDRGITICLVLVACFGVVLAAGATGGVLPFLVDHVPGFAMLRVPGRYKLLAAWTLATSAGYGVAALEAVWGDRGLRKRAIAVAAAAVVLSIVFVVGWGHPHSLKERDAWWSIVMTAIVAGLVIAAVSAPRRIAEASLGALALCALLDAPAFTFVLPYSPPAADARRTHDSDDQYVARLEGARDRFRIYDEFVLGERAGARLRLRDFRGYPALDPISLRRYVDVLDFAKQHPAIITDFNVRWLLVRPHFRYGSSVSFVMPDAAFESRGDSVWEARHPAPLVQWVGAIQIVEPKQALAAVRANEDADGVRRHAIVERADAALLPNAAVLAIAPPDAREGTLERYEPDEIRVSIDAPSDGIVVLNEIMFPGWHVEVDGHAAVPVRANYLLRGVAVGPGHHTITWRFEPRRWRLLVGCYLLALAIMLAAAAWPRRTIRAAAH